MKSFLGGAAFGLVLGAAAMYSLMKADTKEPVASTDAVETSPTELAQTSQGANPQPRDVGSVSTSSPVRVANRSASSMVPTDAPPRNELDQPPPSAPNASTSPIESTHDNSSAAANPIPLHDALRATLAKQPDGHRSLQLHSALERELRDDSWSYYMEQTLGNYLGVRAPQVGVEIINVACRSTACEIQAFDAGEMSPGIARLMSAATKEPWWEFTSMDARSATHESRGIAIIFLSRAQKSEQRPLKRDS
jgi:hypothetical protein